MAEGGSLDKTADESDFFYDFNCSVCIRSKEVHAEAAFYCPRCNEYYCKYCFIQSGCDHDPIGRGNVAKWGRPSQRILFDECPKHSGNTIHLYCPKDDVVCCAICSQADHKFCDEPKYIPLITKGKDIKESLKTVEKELQQLQAKVERLLLERTTLLTDLDHTHKRITTEIREVKSKIIDVLDKLEQNSLNMVNTFKSDLSEKIKSDLHCLNNTNAEILELLSKKKTPNKDESLLFGRMKQSTAMLEDKTHTISDITNVPYSKIVRFEADTKLFDCIQSLLDLGKLTLDTQNKQLTNELCTVSNTSQCQYHPCLKLNQPYTVGQKTSANVDVKGDKLTCSIWDMCQLPGGNIIVADYNNRKLKQLDNTYKVTSHCTLSERPCAVCYTDDGEVAVALGYINAIQFVCVGDKLTAGFSFSIRQSCSSLAYHNKCLYVVSYGDSTVYVYTLSGSLLHTIRTDQHGTELFSNTLYITVSPVSERLYVADCDKGLVTIDRQGNLLATFNRPEQQTAGSVCVDMAGNVFVGWCTDTVLQLRLQGDRNVAQILSESDCIGLWRLCFDNVNTRLIVLCHSAIDTIIVFQLAQ